MVSHDKPFAHATSSIAQRRRRDGYGACRSPGGPALGGFAFYGDYALVVDYGDQ